MIKLTKLNGDTFVLNCDLIETITENPDTTLKLSDGKYYIVKETLDEVVEEVSRYKKQIYRNSIIIKKENYIVEDLEDTE